MATEKHRPIEGEKAEVPNTNSPDQATRTQADPRQIQPPSKTTISSTEAGTPLLSDSAYIVDSEKSDTESELQVILLTFNGFSHSPTKVPKRRPSSPA